MNIDNIRNKVAPKVKWYIKYRTQIWSTVFAVVGAVGGSIATIQTYLPTTKYDTQVLQEKAENLQTIMENLKNIQKQLDELKKLEYNKIETSD